MLTNHQSGTRIDEIAPDIYRIHTPINVPGAGPFNFNQILVADAEPLLFHTGPRALFPLVSEAIGAVVPLQSLRYIAFSHVEADECGALNLLLAAAPRAVPVCSRIGAMVSVSDLADRPPLALTDNQVLVTGGHRLQWVDAPHVPHGWDCGYLMDTTTRTLLCGDLFTQGEGLAPVTTGDILGPSEVFRQPLDYFAHAPQTRRTLERLAQLQPAVLACMHGSAFHGNGAALLRALAERVEDGAAALA
jgi:flavorubredoxin